MSALAKETDLERAWTRLRPLILKAIPFLGGFYDETDLLRGVLAGAFTFWPGERSFTFAAIEEFPKGKRLNLFLSGGDHFEVAEIEKQIVAWAKQQGAINSHTEVRLGLDRLNQQGKPGYYADSGYERVRVVYEKVL